MTCDDKLSMLDIATGTPACGAGARTPTGKDTGTQNAASGGYIIYALEELASGRHYVGLTRRTLDARIASHLTQAKRERRVRAGGLMAALRLVMAFGQRFEQCFSVRILARAETAQAARELEREWIDRLDCRTPNGLNGMRAAAVSAAWITHGLCR